MTSSNGNGASSTTPWGAGLTQSDLMEKDTCLVLDDADNIIGTSSKKETHVFNAKQPHGILHRAFSVFLFDESDGRMLLQQRASTKITFPNVCGILYVLLWNVSSFTPLIHSIHYIYRSGPTRVARIP